MKLAVLINTDAYQILTQIFFFDSYNNYLGFLHLALSPVKPPEAL
jgi:hypothetical protein